MLAGLTLTVGLLLPYHCFRYRHLLTWPALLQGYGFLQFESDEVAKKAIDKLNGMMLGDRALYVGQFVRRTERSRGYDRGSIFPGVTFTFYLSAASGPTAM